MAYGSDSNASKTRSTAIWLGLFFIAALALRVAFGIGTGHDDASGREIFTGNDPYYHDRTLRHLMETGHNLNYDDAINYPDGRSNPNPPLFIWTAAPLAFAFQAANVEDPTGSALNWMTGIWGALTILPVFLLARDLWGRTAGLWAAFFTAISAPHIQRSVWGYADHDAITMFLITLAFACMVKAFRATAVREYVATWSKSEPRLAGIKQAFTSNRTAFLWAALAGTALTATALVWKGYPYALAVLAVGCGFQLLSDHLRNRDSTATFALYLVPLVMVVVLPFLLYYRMFPEFLDGTIWPSLYVLIGVLVAGLILVPTREMPSIVVFPGLLVAGLVGLVLMIWVFPSAGHQVFSGLGYFEQSKLYTTIAEAQRAQLGFVAASFGFFTFLLGFWGFGKALKGAWKGDASFMLIAGWGVVAFFMAFAASRFVMNAVPVFALFIGAAMTALFARLGLGEVSRRFRATHGQGLAARTGKSLTWKSTLGIILVGLFLILPNVWIGVDAGTPSEFDADHGLTDNDPKTVDRFGAFGISFDLRDNGWLDTMAYLAKQDTGLALEDRPAVIAWWDYGHWNVGIGQHPTVADPFQSHYELAGRFLASESEEEGVSWLIILLADYDHNKNGGEFSPAVAQALDQASPGLSGIITPADGYDKQYDLLSAKVNGTAVFALYEGVKDATGKDVGYMAADIRMFPFSACSSGIFYAPVFLANKNPDDFLGLQVRSGSTVLNIQQYGLDDDGNSVRLSEPKLVDTSGLEWVNYQGYAYRPGQTPLDGADPQTGVAISDCRSQQLVPTAKFANSMYVRGYGSYDANTPAGNGLSHWRVVQQSTDDGALGEGIVARESVLLQYFTGTSVSGLVKDEAGNPMPGVTVSFMDGTGASHQTSITDAAGRYTVLAPFSQDGDLRLAVLSGGQEVFNVTNSAFDGFTPDSSGTLALPDILVPFADVTGIAYENTDGVAGFNAGADRALAGVQVTASGKSATTGADGRYTITDLKAGSHSVAASVANYNNATQTVLAKAGQSTTLDLALTVKPSAVTLRFEDNGQPVSLVPMTITGGSLTAPRQATTNSTGVTTTPVSLSPGDYTVTVDHRVNVSGMEQRYQATQAFTVLPGGNPMTVVVTRQT